MLERDCAVCKEQFQLETEDPDEQVVVSLPCGEVYTFIYFLVPHLKPLSPSGHPFHSPWYVVF